MKRDHLISGFTDKHSNELVQVPLGRTGSAFATLYKSDFEYLLSIGLSKSWNTYPNGIVTAPAYRAKGSQVTVARVLLDADIGENVQYVDGDRLNLRRENLRLVNGGWATRRDRDFLTPPGSKPGRPRKIHSIHTLQANTNQ